MLYNIQAARAFAALAVAYFHISLQARYLPVVGYVGVDVFFVISGFIMSLILDSGEDHFFYRRITRIVPLYWAMSVAVFIIAMISPSLLASSTANTENLLKSLFFIPYVKESGLMQPILFLGWTLNYEMYFYLVISVALFVASGSAAVGVAVLGMTIASAAIPLTGCSAAPCIFYASPIVLEFAWGWLAYRAYCACARRVSQTGLPLFAAAGLVALAALVWIDKAGWAGAPHFSAGMPAFAVIVVATAAEAAGWRALWRPLLLLGNASYALYLSHPYVENTYMKLAARLAPKLDPTLTWAGFIACMAAVCTVGISLHLLVERPLLHLIRSRGMVTLLMMKKRRA